VFLIYPKGSAVAVLASVFGIVAIALGATLDPGPVVPPGAPPSLKTIPVPQPRSEDLAVYVKDVNIARQLGKALFWDMQVGSDGVTACATCHFHAGADNRSINQLHPGGDGKWRVRPNFHLAREHFPLRRLSNENDRTSTPIFDVDDVVASQGVFNTEYKRVDPGQGGEQVKRPLDPVFNVGGINVRRVEPRHTPSVINAVFNYRNFWDGRAQHEFNGVNNWGDRDPNAVVARAPTRDGPLEAHRVRLTNSSLASQAVAPILSFDEMAAAGRDTADLANKLTRLRGKKVSLAPPLAMQLVHPDDSVLGPLSRWPQPGLNVNSYDDLIRAAFHREWWDSSHVLRIDDDGAITHVRNKTRPSANNEYSVMEFNFTLFFGLAVQLYQATLVSDDTPYDRWVEGRGTVSEDAARGLQVFMSQDVPQNGVVKIRGARCINCHTGAEFTDASVMSIAKSTVTRSRDLTDGTTVVQKQDLDRGFNNIGVRPTSEDLGVGGVDRFGRTLSATALCRQQQNTQPPCPPASNVFVAVDGAFKAPSLRNVELTAPYFHNGGYLTLESVMQFYSRGGDLWPVLAADDKTMIAPLSVPSLDGVTVGLTADQRRWLVAFLKTLTDERVRRRSAPFDHPQLFIPNGQLNDHVLVIEDRARKGQGVDRVLELPAVGRDGGPPLPGFLE
jgi:cytochrome c peroxidase